MIGRRKRVFFNLLDLLRAIEADQDDFDRIKTFNMEVLGAVIRTEQDVVRHKANLKSLRLSLKNDRPNKEASKAIRKRVKISQHWISHYSQQLWLWKLFGDAIAYIYLDKFSIKHGFFETDSFDIKSGAGMVHGKEGLVNEVRLLFSALEHGVPAVICDITNVLRYGDVCLLGANDPHFMEVKSSDRRNQRGLRQAATLEKLHDFLRNDLATEYRGSPGEVRRQSLTIPERTYVNELNAAIIRAQETGSVVVVPEPGLAYIVVYGNSEPDMANLPLEEGPMIYFSWNDDKNACSWAPYLPFLLSIRDPRHLYDFIEGRLIINILTSAQRLTHNMSQNDWLARFSEDSSYSIQCLHTPTGGVMALSRQFVMRIGHELVSPLWVAESQVAAMSKAYEEQARHCGPFKPYEIDPQVRKFFGIEYDALMADFSSRQDS